MHSHDACLFQNHGTAQDVDAEIRLSGCFPEMLDSLRTCPGKKRALGVPGDLPAVEHGVLTGAVSKGDVHALPAATAGTYDLRDRFRGFGWMELEQLLWNPPGSLE